MSGFSLDIDVGSGSPTVVRASTNYSTGETKIFITSPSDLWKGQKIDIVVDGKVVQTISWDDEDRYH